jgi:hypothetical protein
MFLLPGVVIAWVVTDTPIPPAYAAEIKNYLFTHANQLIDCSHIKIRRAVVHPMSGPGEANTWRC